MDLILAADTGGNYVAVAYLIFVVVLFIYLAIMANKLVNIQKTLSRVLQKISDDRK